jgi:hypothetical protein
MNHAENERITHQDTRGSEGRNARGRRANAYAACGVSGETYQENASRSEGTTCVQGRRFFRASNLHLIADRPFFGAFAVQRYCESLRNRCIVI